MLLSVSYDPSRLTLVMFYLCLSILDEGRLMLILLMF